VTDIKSEAESDSSEVTEPPRDESRPYACMVCEKRFKHKGSLDLHARTHAMDKTHECTTCGKQFTTEGRLLRHLTTHEDTDRKTY